MYLRAKYTKYKMAKTKFSIWRYVICEICKKNGSNRPFLASRVADTIFPPPIEGHHRQLDNQCKDPMDKTKDCRVGQLTSKYQYNQTKNYHQRWRLLILLTLLTLLYVYAHDGCKVFIEFVSWRDGTDRQIIPLSVLGLLEHLQC